MPFAQCQRTRWWRWWNDDNDEEMEVGMVYSVSVALQFEQLTRELEVKVYAGLPSTETRLNQCNFGWVEGRQQKKHLSLLPLSSLWKEDVTWKKLRLERELLLTLMKLKLGLFTLDLGFRFHVSTITVSNIFITWVKLMSRELSALIAWPSQQHVKKSLPTCFRKLYPKDALLTALSASQKFQVDLIWQLLSGVNINITALQLQLQLYSLFNKRKIQNGRYPQLALASRGGKRQERIGLHYSLSNLYKVWRK